MMVVTVSVEVPSLNVHENLTDSKPAKTSFLSQAMVVTKEGS